MPRDQMKRSILTLRDMRLATVDEAIGSFSGYGSVFDVIDSYGTAIAPGAFSETLRDWKRQGALPPMLLNHGGWAVSADDLLPIGAWTKMREDDHGLYVEGQIGALDSDFGKRVYWAVKNNGLRGMSIGFEPIETRKGQDKDEPAYTFTQVKLWEVSVVLWPSNKDSLVDKDSVRSMSLEAFRAYEDGLRDAGFSKRDAAKAVAILKDSRRDAGERVPRDADLVRIDDPLIAEIRSFTAQLAVKADTTADPEIVRQIRAITGLLT